MNPRVCSKATDRLIVVLEYLKTVEFKKVTLTWDRIDDPEAAESGVIVMPIVTIEK